MQNQRIVVPKGCAITTELEIYWNPNPEELIFKYDPALVTLNEWGGGGVCRHTSKPFLGNSKRGVILL